MNQYDVAAMLMNYSIRCTKVESIGNLYKLLDELNKRIDDEERKNMKYEEK